ncbi:PI-PLC domain-containing protein [Streptomyces sp. NPDC048664]|uniref:PI-PLC domain-containing protein n=1 Tax=Streptomyces sp. NPDC048664 TaxID=3154505 RepID=UPI003422B8B9
MRTPHALIAAAAALAAAIAAPPAVTAAAAVPTTGGYYVQSAVTGLDAAANGATVEQHSPKGDEDHQRWNLRPAPSPATSSVLENADTAGSCLGRSGDQARTVACASPDAVWDIAPVGNDRYTLKDPAGDRYLTVGAGSPAQLAVGSPGDLASWYLTPVDPPTRPMPSADRRTLDQVTFLTAHNAYANGVDGGFAPPFVNLVPNQTRGIDRQLADGVRGFMLDIHQTPDGAILCHDSCFLVSRPVALWVDLQRIVSFLKAHPDQVATVFLEDYVDPGVLRGEITRVNGLQDVLFRPDQAGVRQNGWPKVADMIASGHRLLIFSDHDRAADEAAGLTRDSFGVMYQRDWTVENYWSMGSGIGTSDWTCVSRWGGVPLTRTEPGFDPLFVMNHFRDVTIAPTAQTDNTKLADRARRFCQPAARRKPNYLAVDRYDLGDPTSAVNLLNTYTYP